MKRTKALRVAVVTAMISGGAVALAPGAAQAAVINATLVKTTWTGGPDSNWAEPSPDPSGVTYNSRTGRLIIVDGEVEETGAAYPNNVWRGTNLFVAGLDGALLEYDTNTLAYSAEPVGVGFRPASAEWEERLFISDDNLDRIFEVNRGSDGRYGTPDDTQTSFSARFTGTSADDPEDVAIDLELTRDGQLLIIDGYRKEVYVYSPGPNKRFDGLPSAGGDDSVRQFDVEVHGARDPEGIAYNPSRDTIFVLDDPSNQILEFGLQGGPPQNLIKLPMTMKSGAGIALAPPSGNSSGPCNAYIVDRGVDNDTNQDTFNDGRLYEIAIPNLTGSGGSGSMPCSSGGGGGTPTNAPPTVNAGADQSVTMPNAATLDGTITDPEGAAVTAAWTRQSGPGTVTFANAAATDTTATFSAAGTYVLRLTGSDGQASASDDVTVTVAAAPGGGGGGGGGVLDIPVQVGSDDAEQRPNGTVQLSSGDLNLGQEDSALLRVGMRFTNVTIPAGATITNAYVQFTADEVKSAASNLVIAGQASDNPATFTTATNSLSPTARPLTTATVSWAPPAWTTVDARTTAQRTPDIRSVVQEIVDRGDWASGDPLVLIVTGTGERAADSYEGGTRKRPVLHIEYTP
ncbi:PKD domain-containing protein [Geodermatophilus sp. SYSU D01176]